jgi:PAS domain S-box-containing protein
MADEQALPLAGAEAPAGSMAATRVAEVTPSEEAHEDAVAARLHATEARLHLAEAQLRHVEERYDALVRVAGQIVWTTPPDGHVEDVPLWCRYTGQSAEEARGWGWLEAIHPDDRQQTMAAWSSAVSARSPYQIEYRIRRADGVYRSFLVRGVPLVGPDGEICEWIGFCTDISDHQQAEDERLILLARERAAAQARALALQEANRRMDSFLGIASHELRTPMTSVRVNIQMAERALRALLGEEATSVAKMVAVVERAHELLVRANRQFGRQNRLVGDLIDATRAKTGKLELRREQLDLAELVRETVRDHRLMYPEREIMTSITAESVPVFADPDRIGQVLANYLSNAVKYSAEELPISVWLRVRGTKTKVSVRDRGPGLPPEEQGRIWKRFYRVEGIQEQSGSSVGLGLGLYLCRNIVEQHGGQVGVLSAPNRGATFWFSLPLLKADESSATS